MLSTPIRWRLPHLFSVSFLLCGLLLTACADDSGSASGTASAASKSKADTQAAAHAAGHPEVAAGGSSASKTAKKGEKAARHPNERPVPAFEGTTLSGTRLAMRDMLGTRLVLFFFNPEIASNPKTVGAREVGLAVQEAADVASDHNFKIIGVGVGSSPAKLSRFVEEQGYDFPVLDDSSGSISQKLRLQIPIAILGVDADGYVGFGIANFAPGDKATASARDQLRESLRIETPAGGGDGELFSFPVAPQLDVVSMGTGESISIESLRGRAAIVIFFLHTCPHCHHALEAIQKIMKGLPDDQKPELVAISVQNSPAAIRKALGDLNLDFFTPYLDPGDKAAERWGVTGGVPVVTVIDTEGRIRHRSQGWSEKRDGGMLRMRVAAATGATVPMLLDAKGFTGNDACGVCHEQEYATWQYTKHATAFDTLVTHGADRRKDCIGCHVVGYEEKGGYDFFTRPAHLEDVGCESCHGRGGPHLSPSFVPVAENGKKNYAQVCSTCHNPTHSLGFDFETFHPRVSHDEIAGLSNLERARLLKGGPSRDLLPTTSDYVGSLACQSCHTKEFETWKASPHGHAVATLEAKGEASNTECLLCHTTAYGKPGGFPAGAKVADHGDLASVGCESCHGPGGDHIGENAKRVGTILSLGDKCDSCVILKVCGSCHDDANDPGFQFEVEQRIDDQRHGTIESAATRAGESAFHMHDPEDSEASRSLARAAGEAHDRALLRHALDHSFRAVPAQEAGTSDSETNGQAGGRG